MKVQVVLLLIAVGSAAALSPQAEVGLQSMHDFFGDMMGGMASNLMNSFGLGGLGGMANGMANEAANAAKQGMGAMGSIANQGMGAMGSIANQGMGALGGLSNMFGGFGDVITQILQSWMNIFQQIGSGIGDFLTAIFNVFKSFVDNFFSILGGLPGKSRLEVNTMFAKTGNVFASAMRMKLNPQANRQAIRQELLSLQKVMETHHNSATELVSSIKARAPHISGAASDAFAHARAEMNKHVSAFSPDARKGLEKMRLQAVRAKFDVGSIISSMLGMVTGGGGFNPLSIFFSIIKNLFSLFQMFF